MSTELLIEYHTFLNRFNDRKKTVDNIIKWFYESGIEKFPITQELLDANPKFLELISGSKSIKRLEIEQIYGDELAKLTPFEHLSAIKEIKFFNSSINGFFKYSSYLTSLESIYISQDDQILEDQVIDDQISNLQSLTELSIDSLKVNYIPDSLCTLKNLHTLSLSTRILPPQNLYLLPELESLDINIGNENLDRNYVLEVVSSINNLKYFGYGDGHSKHVPAFRNNLLNLESFSLYMIHATEVPAIVREMGNLKQLSLTLDWEEIPEWITELKNLEYLSFDMLPNNALPVFLKKLPKLKAINVVGCFELRTNEQKIEQVKRDFADFKVIGINADHY